MKTLSYLFAVVGIGCAVGATAALSTTFVGVASLRQLKFYAFAFGFLTGISLCVPGSPTDRVSQTTRTVQNSITGVFCGWMIVCAVWFLIAARGHVDGVDLNYFVCFARDRAWNYEPSRAVSYSYFPGVYVFWSAIISRFGSDTTTIQNSVIALLATNALLVGLLCKRTTGLWCAAAAGTTLYIAIAARFESLDGTSEPLATIPFLLALLGWDYFRQKQGVANIILGIGFGLALFCKQQAGVLSVGACWLLVSNDELGLSSHRQRIVSFLKIASVSALTLFVAILIDGRGLAPLTGGLSFASKYARKNEWVHNTYSLFRNDESFGFMLGIAVMGLCLSRRRFLAALTPAGRTVSGILLVATAACFIQFQVRGYFHYCLLQVPCVVIAFVTLTTAVASQCNTMTRHHCLRRVVAAAIIVLPLAYVGDRRAAIAVFNPIEPIQVNSNFAPWDKTGFIYESLEALRPHVETGRPAVVIPARRSVLYRELELVCPRGYGFSEYRDLPTFDLDELDYIVVAREPRLEPDQVEWEISDCDKFIDRVERSKQFQQIDTRALTLYYKP